MEATPLRVGIIAHSPRHRKTLAKILDENGLDVVKEEIMQSHLPDKVDHEVADVLLVNLDDTDEPGIEILIAETKLPILFNDSASIRKSTTVSGKAWGNRLAKKLVELAQNNTYVLKPGSKKDKGNTRSQSQESQDKHPSDTSPDLHLVESEPQVENDPESSSNDEIEISIPVELEHVEELQASKARWEEQEVESNSNPEELESAQENDEITGSDEDGVQSDVTAPSVFEDISYDGGLDFEPVVTKEVSQPDESADDDAPRLDIESDTENTEKEKISEADTAEYRNINIDEPQGSRDDTEALDLIAASNELLQGKTGSTVQSAPVKEAEQVWVLGASIGGPEAVKRFLAALPDDLPVGFVLAQHIGSGFVSLLAEQLGRVSDLHITGAEEGMVVQENNLMVAPVEKRLSFNELGKIVLMPVNQQSIYSPSIDDVMIEVSNRFGSRANAIIFSGMGNDGTAGCQTVSEHGGVIWAQTADTCVISSMADSVRNTGIVTYSASPEDLAYNLVQYLDMG